mmetsp:Transcript_44513/g.80026  ORF Transcript_44513/g.80026 Transcript_44513/m.80026 type:complete len:209 (+) Transcript_44513:140-766(+)
MLLLNSPRCHPQRQPVRMMCCHQWAHLKCLDQPLFPPCVDLARIWKWMISLDGPQVADMAAGTVAVVEARVAEAAKLVAAAVAVAAVAAVDPAAAAVAAAVTVAAAVAPEVAARQPCAPLVRPCTTRPVVSIFTTIRLGTLCGISQKQALRASGALEAGRPWRLRGSSMGRVLIVPESQHQPTSRLLGWRTWRAGPRPQSCGLACFPA